MRQTKIKIKDHIMYLYISFSVLQYIYTNYVYYTLIQKNINLPYYNFGQVILIMSLNTLVIYLCTFSIFKYVIVKESEQTSRMGIENETIDLIVNKLNSKINKDKYTDTLTQIPNRYGLEDTFIRYKNDTKIKHCTCLLIDINRFKQVNDRLTYPQADKILISIASKLYSLNNRRIKVCRTENNEFAVLVLGQTEHKYIKELCNRILKLTNEGIEISDKKVKLTVSIGISEINSDTDVFNNIIREASIAMYASKLETDNTIRYYNKNMKNQFTEELGIINELKNKTFEEELYLVYQPIHSTKSSNDTVKIETLSRWESKNIGIINTQMFINISEKTGDIFELTEDIVNKVCKQIIEWRESDVTYDEVAINISPSILQKSYELNRLMDIIERNDISPGQICFEITEESMISNMEECSNSVQEARARGYSIALDDFGTGQSSLSLINNLPVDIIKIDRSFVIDVENDINKLRLLTGIIHLIKGINKPIVVEGIENEDQIKLIKHLDIDYIQGYYYSKPLCSKDLNEYYSKIKK